MINPAEPVLAFVDEEIRALEANRAPSSNHYYNEIVADYMREFLPPYHHDAQFVTPLLTSRQAFRDVKDMASRYHLAIQYLLAAREFLLAEINESSYYE